MIPDEILRSLSSFFTGRGAEFKVTAATGLSGGCINNVSRLDTSLGIFCLKYNAAGAYPGMFEAEALGLNLLATTREIRVPAMICTGTAGRFSYILLEYIGSSRKQPSFMEDFGRQLACLHRHTETSFGLDHDNYMGSLAQRNNRHETWISFFREERVEPQVRIAREGDYLSGADLAAFERLYLKLEAILPAIRPSLIHGDLWGGNYMVDDNGNPCLIDPAVHFGNREAEIAMTTLFGGFDPGFYAAYQSEWPMETGWRERLAIYNLYPLLIHVNLFGSGYLGGVQQVLRKF